MSREEKARKIRAHITQIASGKDSWSINELRIVLGLERIVARLIHHKDLEKHLVYKGGFVLMKAHGSVRITRELDFETVWKRTLSMLKKLDEGVKA